MDINFNSSTDLRLLGQVAQGDPTSWEVFAQKYGSILRAWCLRWGSSPQDADDLVQEILMRVFQKLDQYEVQEGSRFSGWLKTVAYHCWLNLRQKFLRHHELDDPKSLPENVQAQLASSMARNDLIAVFESMADQEILNLAMSRVKVRVSESSWDCFVQSCREHESGADIAARLQMETAAVYMAVCRVRKLIRDEVAIIDSNDHC